MRNPWHFFVKVEGSRIDFELLRAPGDTVQTPPFTPEDDAILDRIAKQLGATHRVKAGPESLRRYAIVSPDTGYTPIELTSAPLVLQDFLDADNPLLNRTR